MEKSDQIELLAQVRAIRHLLELLYADAYRSNPQAMQRICGDLQTMLRALPSVADTPATDHEIETLARAATHVQLFEQDVLRRIGA